MKLLRYTFIIYLVVIMFCSPCTTADELQDDILNQFQVDTYVSELMPLVEEIAGRKFKEEPECWLMTADELIGNALFRMYIGGGLRTGKHEEIEKEVRSYFEYMTAMCAEGEIYLLPERMQGLMDRAGINPDDQEGFVKIILAHEMAHALQHQHVGSFEAMWRTYKSDKADAADAVQEGFAFFIQGEVAKRLGLSELHQQYFDLIIGTNSPSTLSGEDEAESGTNTTCGWFRYLGGRDFIAWHQEKHGMSFIWYILKHPPVCSSMIFHPATYSSTLPSSQNYKGVLDGIEKHLGKRRWKVNTLELGAIRAREGAAKFYPGMLGELMMHVDHFQIRDLEHDDTIISISAIILDSPSITQELADTFDKVYIANLDDRVIEMPTPITFNWIEADKATKWWCVADEDGKRITRRSFSVVRGRTLIRLLLRNIEASSKDIATVFDEVFHRMPKEACSSYRKELRVERTH